MQDESRRRRLQDRIVRNPRGWLQRKWDQKSSKGWTAQRVGRGDDSRGSKRLSGRIRILRLLLRPPSAVVVCMVEEYIYCMYTPVHAHRHACPRALPWLPPSTAEHCGGACALSRRDSFEIIAIRHFSSTKMDGGAYGGGKAGAPFDPIAFVQRPQVILRAVCLVSRCAPVNGMIVDSPTSADNRCRGRIRFLDAVYSLILKGSPSVLLYLLPPLPRWGSIDFSRIPAVRPVYPMEFYGALIASRSGTLIANLLHVPCSSSLGRGAVFHEMQRRIRRWCRECCSILLTASIVDASAPIFSSL